MRRGTKPELVKSEDVITGVNLSSDFTAEHEWGIKEIQEAFGIDSRIESYGLAKRKITQLPKGFQLIDNHSGTVMKGGHIGGFGYFHYDLFKSGYASELHFYKETLRAAWDESSFAVISEDPEQIAALQTIHDAFASLDIIIMLGGQKFIENAGLVIGIASRLPKSLTDGWKEFDKTHHELVKEADATGIKKLLSEKNKRYYALSPRRDKAGKLTFWLNPMEQHENNSGYFTLEDLKDWSEDKGKIVKVKK